jgi:hypothetical protein
MLGTLARVLADTKIRTSEEFYWADVEGDIEDVNGVLKITVIRVVFHLKVSRDKYEAVKNAFGSYLVQCPAAQSIIGSIRINDDLVLEDLA